VLSRLLPPYVASEEHVGEATAGGLLPEEEARVVHAVGQRQRQYATVRRCARTCLCRLGHPPVPLLAGRDGAPCWPTGVRGSMTHCAGYAAAAVGSTRDVVALGIDAEPDAPLPDGVLDVVASATEQQRLARLPGQPGTPSWDRLLFSAKESVYKAWFPVVGVWLDAEDIEVAIDATGGFTAALSRAGLVVEGRPVTLLRGTWAQEQEVLVTAVVLPATATSGTA
jgi:4'-phosphopantetheinyl transferase EntD